MARTKVIVTGHKEIDRKLATLEAKIAAKIVRTSIRKGGKLIQGKAKKNISSSNRSGKTQTGIKVRSAKRSRGRIGISVGTTERKKGNAKDPFGGAQLEFGTKNMRAEPFLRPAGYGSEKEVREFIVADILSELRALEK